MWSYVSVEMESVTAFAILALIWSGVSSKVIRLWSEGSDLLIFCCGFLRLITRGKLPTNSEKRREVRVIGRERGEDNGEGER